MGEQRRSHRAGLGVVGIVLALIAWNGVSASQDCRALRPVHEGEAAPGFVIPSISFDGTLGPKFKLSSTRGSVVVLDFWATWCGPCKASMPVLEGIAKKYSSQGLVVLSINIEGAEAAGKARAMVQRLAPSVQLLSDTGEAARLYKVNTIPHMLILDRRGVVRWVHRGFGSMASLREDLDRAVKALL